MHVRADFLGRGCTNGKPFDKVAKLAFGYRLAHSRDVKKRCCSEEVTPIASVAAATRQTYVDRESLHRALTSDLVGWTVSEMREAPLFTHAAAHQLGDIRLLELSGNPFAAIRGHAEISGDSDTYLGITYFCGTTQSYWIPDGRTVDRHACESAAV